MKKVKRLTSNPAEFSVQILNDDGTVAHGNMMAVTKDTKQSELDTFETATVAAYVAKAAEIAAKKAAVDQAASNAASLATAAGYVNGTKTEAYNP